MLKLKKLFKKSPIVVVIVGVLIASVASAALVVTYVTVTGEATVTQSVVFEGESIAQVDSITDIAGGEIDTNEVELMNRSTVASPIGFVTTQVPSVGVTTTYWSTVELRMKDAAWNVIAGGEATTTYELVSSTFNYEFEATGLAPETDYALIYYADYPNRFGQWGGNNPGALIAIFGTDENGNIYDSETESEPIKDSINLDMNLPTSPDWNGGVEANYCDYANGIDSYDLCKGAKIQLVLKDDYDEGENKLTAWNPTKYLFETDLITYSDTDVDGSALYLGNGTLNVLIRNIFAPDAYGNFIITTQVQPQ